MLQTQYCNRNTRWNNLWSLHGTATYAIIHTTTLPCVQRHQSHRHSIEWVLKFHGMLFCLEAAHRKLARPQHISTLSSAIQLTQRARKEDCIQMHFLVCPRKLLPQHELKSACKIDLRIQLRKTCSSRHLISFILGLVWVHSQHKLVRRSFSSYFIQFTHYKPLTLNTIQFKINYDFHGYQQQLRN